MARLQLNDISLVIVDTVNSELARMALADTLRHVDFGEVLVYRGEVPLGIDDGRKRREIQVKHVQTLDDAVRIYWYDAPYEAKKDHLLYMQWDSWVINPDAWTDEFLAYDYIGAPWWYTDGRNVGNGGFSLRSRKLMRHVGADAEKYPWATLEDDQLCRVLRPELEKEGFRWAPEELAYRFSRETTGWERPGRSFGFHGLFTWPLFLTPAQIGERSRHFNEYITGGAAYREMLKNQARVAGAREDAQKAFEATVKKMVEHQNKREFAEAAAIAQQITRLEATTDFEKAARAEALAALANYQYSLGHLGTALDLYHEATRILPNIANLHRMIALLWKELGWFSRAQQEAKIAAAVEPGNVVAQLTLALLSVEVADEKTARAAIGKVLELEPTNTAALVALAGIEADVANYGEAIRICRDIIEMKPDASTLSDVYHTLGAAYLRQVKPDEALAYIERPEGLDHPPQIWNRGIAHLMKGDYERGWRDYEARFKMSAGRNTGGRFGVPMWDGQRGARRVHLHYEQGFGDTIQMGRFIPMVKALGHDVSVEVQPALYTLFKNSFPDVNVVSAAHDYPGIAGIPWDFDCHLPMMSLPYALGITFDNLPAETPYLKADPGKVEEYAAMLAWDGGKKVGFCWAGQSLLDKSLFMRTIDKWRSMTRKQIQPLFNIKGYMAVSLQMGERLHPCVSGDFEDFADTAALIENLDLVITVDTAVAHLAGALGKPTWILNRRDSCWRWLLDREDSPWYPSVRLYRQTERGGWDDVLERVMRDLQAFAAGDNT